MPYAIQKTKPVDVSRFALLLKRSVGALEGINEFPTTLALTRIGGGDFSFSERSAIDSAWAAYDQSTDDADEASEQTAVHTAIGQFRQAHASWDSLTTSQQSAVVKKMLLVLARQLSGR